MAKLDIQALAGQIICAAETIAGRMNEIDEEVGSLLEKRASIETVLLTRDDYAKVLRGYIQSAGERHKKILESQFKGQDTTARAAELRQMPVDIFSSLGQGAAITQDALCFFFADMMLSRLDPILDQMPFCEGKGAMSLEQIRAEIGSIQAKIDELASERDELMEALTAFKMSE